MIKYIKEVYDIMNIENKQTTSIKTDVTKLPKEFQETLYYYTSGFYDVICHYSQFITDKTQFAPLLLWDRDGKGMYHELTDKDKSDVKQIHELIASQPIEENKLIRYERLRSDADYSDYEIGKVLNLGVRSATRDKEFIKNLEENRVEGFFTKEKGLNRFKNVKFIFNTSKSLDISSISKWPEQLEELIQGSYKIVDTKFIEGKNPYTEFIKMPFQKYVEENNLKTEIRISKKGNENIVVHMPNGNERIFLLEKWKTGEIKYFGEIEHKEDKMERLEVYLEYVDDKN